MLKRIANKLVRNNFVQFCIRKNRNSTGVFLPFLDVNAQDIVAAPIKLLNGWGRLEYEHANRWRRIHGSASLRIPTRTGIDFLLIHYKNSSDVINAQITIAGKAGTASFHAHLGHQVIVVERAKIALSLSEDLSIIISDDDNTPHYQKNIDILFGGIALLSQIGPPAKIKNLHTGGFRLRSKDDVARFVGLSHHLAQHSNAALLNYFSKFSFDFPKPPADSSSLEYRNFWIEQYVKLSNKEYTVDNEKHKFEDAMFNQVFPYNTKNPVTIGEQLIAAGSIVAAFADVPIGGSVLEMGVGWGNPALQLALSGYRITALDIEEKYLRIVKNRFRQLDLNLETIHGDFFEATKVGKTYNAVLFFESFHHCLDHQELLVELKKNMAPKGVIIFAGEAITTEIPFDWGLNPSGQAVWSIAHHGWMELCFHTDYFRKMLERLGFSVTEFPCPQTAAGRVFKAQLP